MPSSVPPEPPRPASERELTAPVALLGDDGRLNPDAVGWSRAPLHDTSGIGRGRRGRMRNKRWEYWAVTTPTHIVAVTVSHLDYAALCSVYLYDRASKLELDRTVVAPLGRGVELPASFGAGPAKASVKGLRAEFAEIDGGHRLVAETDRVRLDVLAELPDRHESLSVVVPWSADRFQYTVKDVARPARGTIAVDGDVHTLPAGRSWAVLDHGRGRWPYRIDWKWGAASGVEQGRRIGLQFGGLWTDGTGSTENGLQLDGRMHKISTALEWTCSADDWSAPWSIRGERVALEFTPFHVRESTMNLGLVANDTRQAFGHYRGTVVADDGEVVPVGHLLGWAEYVRNRW
ncbi:DUF2804 domain-containing protein [Agromyces seonyuensis]|uniref:DUF2804 family protein n=1 Tax=Agromyces seonyuensis TaxID=2662446 RepID=A0A6I4NSE5_9MICO|nr:DUF2804 domain-containing protein [Agromyces seonyuensis]MWB97173.1 DUF2804 family protein [Agromyces seonyuensis]